MTDPAVNVDPAAHSRRARWLLWIGIAVVVVIVGLGLWLASRPAPEQWQGEVEADEINVATKALARVETLAVDEGDRVRRGQVMAILSAPEIDGGQQQAQAALDSARALQSVAIEGARAEDLTSLRSTWLAA